MAGLRARGARRSAPRSRHFLHRPVAAQIVRDARVTGDEVVLDLGAGTGRLTAELARVARRVVAVELDPGLALRLRDRWPNVDVIAADAATIELPAAPFRVVANLPFHRTTDLLHLLLDDPDTSLVRADLIVEWAVAVRQALPWPSTLNGVVWGATYETSLVRRLPRRMFTPAPSVDAGLLVIRRRAEPLVPAERLDGFRRYVAAGFRHGVTRIIPGLPRGTTARDLDTHQWASCFRAPEGAPFRRRRAP